MRNRKQVVQRSAPANEWVVEANRYEHLDREERLIHFAGYMQKIREATVELKSGRKIWGPLPWLADQMGSALNEGMLEGHSDQHTVDMLMGVGCKKGKKLQVLEMLVSRMKAIGDEYLEYEGTDQDYWDEAVFARFCLNRLLDRYMGKFEG